MELTWRNLTLPEEMYQLKFFHHNEYLQPIITSLRQPLNKDKQLQKCHVEIWNTYIEKISQIMIPMSDYERTKNMAQWWKRSRCYMVSDQTGIYNLLSKYAIPVFQWCPTYPLSTFMYSTLLVTSDPNVDNDLTHIYSLGASALSDNMLS